MFCNISVKTLLDPEFFPELVEFMEENTGLSESLIFEVGQPGILDLDADESVPSIRSARSDTASRSTMSAISTWIRQLARPLVPLR